MIGLVFLVCFGNGQCFMKSPDTVFVRQEDCENTAYRLIDDAMDKVSKGIIPAHNVTFKCVQFGEPA